MAGKIAISFAVSAVSDLEDIRAYYTEQNVPHVGDRLVSAVVSHVEKLAKHPDMGRAVPEFGVEYLRELIFPPFRIVYRRDANKVRILRVWRSERLLKLPDSEKEKP